MKKIFLAIILLVLPQIGSAHGLATEKKQFIDPYLVNFEYDELGNVPAGKLVLYNFEMFDKDSRSVMFDKVFVKFLQKSNKQVAFTADLVPSDILVDGIQVARLNTVLHDAGEYTAELSFFDDNKEIVNANFDFAVDGVAAGSNSPLYIKYLWVVSLIAGVIIGLGLKQKHSR